jgi:hypothetical protein
MNNHRAKAVLFVVGGGLALGLVALAWAIGPGSSEAEQGAMNNCPQAGKWAISVWGGSDGTESVQALDTCGAGAIDFAYYLDPVTNGWLGYFAGRPEITKLLTLDSMQGIIAHGAMVAPTPSPTPTVTATVVPVGPWTGAWSTDWGRMELTQTDSTVTGTYEFDEGQIQGTVQGDKLIGTWAEAPTDGGFAREGEFEFTMSADGNSFLGRWRYDSSGDWEEWTGTRIS